jgi:hypothetical protein
MNAYQRYYQKNREQILAKMRERDAARRAAVRAAAAQSAEVREEVREEMREKYHRNVESKITKQLKIWLDDPLISDTFKQFIKQSVWEHKHRISPAFVRGLGTLSIVDAFKYNQEFPPTKADGGEASGSEAEAEA